MTDERRSEMELVVELTAAKLDLKFTKAITDLEKRIDKKLEERRRWTIGTWIAVFGPTLALIGICISYWR